MSDKHLLLKNNMPKRLFDLGFLGGLFASFID